MKLNPTIISLTLACGVLAAPALAQQAPPAVSEVIAFKLHGAEDVNQKVIDSLKAALHYATTVQGNTCTNQFKVATFAGSNSGTYVVILNCPNLEALAVSGGKVNNDAQFQKMRSDVFAKLQAAKSEDVGTSVYMDVP
jgi:hypothetical protein